MDTGSVQWEGVAGQFGMHVDRISLGRRGGENYYSWEGWN